MLIVYKLNMLCLLPSGCIFLGANLMNQSGMVKAILIWIVPAVVLLLTLFPLELTVYYPLLLQIVVSLTAAYIAYLLFVQKPTYYLFWGIAFVIVVLIYNPIVRLSILMEGEVPLALVTATLYLTNWWFVFRSNKRSLL